MGIAGSRVGGVRYGEFSNGQCAGKQNVPPFAQRQVLRARHPEIPWQQGIVFRSHAPGSPFLGVCFGEREHGKKGKWGFFRKEATIPSDCHEIDGTEKIRLVACD